MPDDPGFLPRLAAIFLTKIQGFPLFAPYMYDYLNQGWGNSVLAFAAIAISWPTPLILWKYGATLRAMSPYATNGHL